MTPDSMSGPEAATRVGHSPESSPVDVLMIIEAEFATTHLVELMLKACAPHGVTYRKRLLNQLSKDDFIPGTVPLFVRCGDPSLPGWIRLLADADWPYLYYLDDNFWRIEGDTPLARYYRHPLVRRSLDEAVKCARTVLVHSPDLAQFLAGRNNKIALLPAFFDFDLIADVKVETSDEIRIGFAGSLLRVADLEMVRPILAPLLGAHPGVVFEFAGVMPRDIVVNERVRFFPHVDDYDTYIRFQAARGWAIGLAPLVDSEANRCKTDNKYREYGACRIAGVYSAVAPYQHSVRDGETGLLVGFSSSDWLKALTELIVNPERRALIGNAAYEDVQARYSIEKVAPQWVEVLRATKLPLTSYRALPGNPPIMLRSRMSRWKLGASIAYQEGGLPMVLTKTISKLRRALDR
jgi:glycosyltransferase involved in cell wall biosynthesis